LWRGAARRSFDAGEPPAQPANPSKSAPPRLSETAALRITAKNTGDDTYVAAAPVFPGFARRLISRRAREKIQVFASDALGGFDLWVVADAVERDHVRIRHELAVAIGHVFAG